MNRRPLPILALAATFVVACVSGCEDSGADVKPDGPASYTPTAKDLMKSPPKVGGAVRGKD